MCTNTSGPHSSPSFLATLLHPLSSPSFLSSPSIFVPLARFVLTVGLSLLEIRARVASKGYLARYVWKKISQTCHGDITVAVYGFLHTLFNHTHAVSSRLGIPGRLCNSIARNFQVLSSGLSYVISFKLLSTVSAHEDTTGQFVGPSTYR